MLYFLMLHVYLKKRLKRIKKFNHKSGREIRGYVRINFFNHYFMYNIPRNSLSQAILTNLVNCIQREDKKNN